MRRVPKSGWVLPHTTSQAAFERAGEELWMGLGHRGEGARQERYREHFHRSDAELAGQGPGSTAELGFGLARLHQHALGAPKERSARVGEGDFALGAHEELNVERQLEARDRLAHRRRRDVHDLCAADERASARGGAEVAEVGERVVGHRPSVASTLSRWEPMTRT